MASRNPTARAAVLVLAALLIAAAGWTSPAAAQSGNGLYEPFPEAAVKERAQRYVERLRGRTRAPERRYSDAELAAGAFVGAAGRGRALTPAAPSTGEVGAGAASARATGGVPAGSGLSVQIMLLVVALALPTAALVGRGRFRAA